MKHLGTVRIETKRLILRPFCIEDANDMFQNWANSDVVTRYLTWSPHESVEASRGLIELWVKQYGDLKKYEWCIELKETHKAIGSIGVVSIDENVDAMEVGYCISEAYWHQGLMSEALKAVVEFLFDNVGANRVWARHDRQNTYSGKVMEKAGLIYEGTLRSAGRNNTGICDNVVFGLTKADYIIRNKS